MKITFTPLSSGIGEISLFLSWKNKYIINKRRASPQAINNPPTVFIDSFFLK